MGMTSTRESWPWDVTQTFNIGIIPVLSAHATTAKRPITRMVQIHLVKGHHTPTMLAPAVLLLPGVNAQFSISTPPMDYPAILGDLRAVLALRSERGSLEGRLASLHP